MLSRSLTILIPNKTEENIDNMLNETESLFPEAQIIICTDRECHGKGWAVREALSQATGEVICFIDGDMDIHPRMISRLLPHLSEFDVVVGKKDTRSKTARWVLTILSRIYIRMMFGIPVDTQTGIKVFSRHVLPEWKCDSFAFDIEILYKIKKQGVRMFEVTIESKTTKRMKLSSILKTLIETIKIKGEI